MGLLEGKVAVVTGAGRGIGRGEAIELARQGAQVVVNDVDADAAAAVAAEIGPANALVAAGNCSDVETADAVVHDTLTRFGRLDAIVNNAGIVRDRTIAKMSPDEWDAVIAVHLRGHYALTHAACAYWKEQGGAPNTGHIVCTASTSGLLGNFGQANYGAAKAGIAAFSTIVAQEMARYGVNCNAIAPAARTRMTQGAYGDIPDGSGADASGAGEPVPASSSSDVFDFWHPDNVGPMVAYLCSDAASHISGKVFGVQGDTVELYRPWTSVAVIENDRRRWDADALVSRVGELFEASGIVPGAENMMAKLRYSMTDRNRAPR